MVHITEIPEESNGGDENKKQEEDRSSFPIPAELTEICIALVPRCHYPMISQVSNSFRRLIASSSLYETRSRLNLTELVLYAAFRFPPYDSPRLCILHGKKFILLGSIPHLPFGSCIVTVGTNMYVIGGRRAGQEITSDVLLIDCRTHKFRFLPSMQRARYLAAAGVVDGKIYVMGGCEKQRSDSSWIEVFDVEEEIWNSVPGPYPYNSLRSGEFVTYVVIEEKLSIWDPAYCLWIESCCLIDDMVYCIDPLCRLGHPIVAYDPKAERWRAVQNIVFGYCPITWPFYHYYYEPRMTSFGGKLVVLGSHPNQLLINGRVESVICCVKIALERREGGVIWGEVESVNHVFSSELVMPATVFVRTLTF